MNRGRDRPTSLGDALKGYLEESGLEERIAKASVVPEWTDLVGARVAAHTVPLRVSGGTLFVAVRSSAWLMELRMMESEILRRLNAGRKKGRIEQVRFVMGENGGV